VDGDAVLIVQDDGPGIPPELGRRVFERFVRSGRDGGRGSGLGLAIVSAVAESHHGSVSLQEPGDGPGTRFVIRIPLDQSAEAMLPDGAGDPTETAAAAQTSTTTGSTIGRRRRRS
jgi:signal transduction histidine kinase